jgi:zinc D-Ala-D-Ala carboxypeptidase|tara:strand:+ start:692 stop:1054 length:363 start_codon:yes stop_codon:yes gene_type:complete
MSNFKYFTKDEFACQYTGNNLIEDSLIHKLDLLREACDFPFIISSGYRDPTHPIEAKKTKAGTHSKGIAADIKVQNGMQRYSIVQHAISLGFNGIGVARNFIHVDIRNSDSGPTPVMWCY